MHRERQIKKPWLCRAVVDHYEMLNVTLLVYHPTNLASQPLPAYLFSQCYAADDLQGLEMTNENSPSNAAAGR